MSDSVARLEIERHLLGKATFYSKQTSFVFFVLSSLSSLSAKSILRSLIGNQIIITVIIIHCKTKKKRRHASFCFGLLEPKSFAFGGAMAT